MTNGTLLCGREREKMTNDEVKMEDNSAPRSGVQVIARAAAVLRKLQDHPAGLTLGELAKLLKLPRSTVQRIVEALADENFVIAASPTRGVRLGPALLALAAVAAGTNMQRFGRFGNTDGFWTSNPQSRIDFGLNAGAPQTSICP